MKKFLKSIVKKAALFLLVLMSYANDAIDEAKK